MEMTFVELFAGVGGLSRGLEMAGWRCVGHAEWEAFPRRVLKHRWPDVPLWGDVSKLNGYDIVQEVGPFTMLTFGAPCQDFSIAGKRDGMDGERSVLVLDALRIWEESKAPLALYENVVGMLSSNNGEDFASILSVFVGDPVAVPARGWKGGGGVVRGRRGVAAWRVLDAQYFGVPQRRRRVFVLGTRTGAIDPVQVLSLLEGVSGHPAPRRATRQGATADAGRGPALTFDARGQGQDQGMMSLAFDDRNQATSVDSYHTIRTGSFSRYADAVLTYDARGNGEGQVVNTMAGDHQNRVTDYTAIVLHQRDGKSVGGEDVPHAPLTYEWHGADSRFTEITIAPTLNTRQDNGQGNVLSVIMRQREGKPGGGKGPLLSPERSLTLGTANDQVVFMVDKQTGLPTEGIAPTLKTDLSHQMGPVLAMASGQANAEITENIAPSLTLLHEAPIAFTPGIPRRLTPVECERLMGWPDGWTDVPDEKGKPAPDTARYKACGNGVASPVAAWIGFRLRAAIAGQHPDAYEVRDA